MATYKKLEHTPVEIVTLAEFKAQLKEVDPTEAHPEDALFQLYIDASVEECEDYINRAIIERKYKISGKSFQEVIVQSLHTIQSIDKIEYKPENYTSGDLEVLPEEAYSLQRIDKVENRLEYTEGYNLPTVKQFTPDAVQLSITVGLGKVSKKIKNAVLLKAAARDQYRSDYVKNKTTASETLLQSFKKY
tara:strand:+ start:628 stop:1197 length:570 start_codon:yes stop_codon:yes gene_type:complete